MKLEYRNLSGGRICSIEFQAIRSGKGDLLQDKRKEKYWGVTHQGYHLCILFSKKYCLMKIQVFVLNYPVMGDRQNFSPRD